MKLSCLGIVAIGLSSIVAVACIVLLALVTYGILDRGSEIEYETQAKIVHVTFHPATVYLMGGKFAVPSCTPAYWFVEVEVQGIRAAGSFNSEVAKVGEMRKVRYSRGRFSNSLHLRKVE